MENQNPRTDRLKSLFLTHPTVDKFYYTSDDTPFIEKHHAEAHANTLEDKSLASFSRDLLAAIDEVKVRLNASAEGEETGGKETGGEKLKGETSTGNQEKGEQEKEVQPLSLEAARLEFEKLTGKPAGNRKLETLLAQIAEAQTK